MLRSLALTLVLLNGVYFAWSQGLLLAYGFGPVAQSEPQRLAQQIQPEALKLLTAKEELALVEAAKEPAPKPSACLQVGVFDEAQGARLRAALAAAQLPEGTWLLEDVVAPGRWIVYVGKFPNSEVLAKKRIELANLNLKLQALTNPALQPGLSLGGGDSQADANALLESLGRRGLRAAKVVQEYPPTRGTLLRVPVVDDALRTRLDALKPALAGKSWVDCP